MAADCQFPDANSPGLMNLQLAALCRLPIQLSFSITASNRIGNPTASCHLPSNKNLRIGIWLPFASCLFRCYALKPSQFELASGCQLPFAIAINKILRIGNWLPFASCLYSFNSYKPSQIKLATGCQLAVANLPGFTNWQLAAVCRLPIYLLFSLTASNRISICPPVVRPIHLRIGIWLPLGSCLFSCYALHPSQNRIGIWLPVASCQFTRICELASGCRLLVAYSALIVLNPLKSNRHLAVSCHFVRTDELANSCLLPVAYSPVILYNCLKSNWHLTASCQLPIHKNLQIGIWLSFASCLFSCYAQNPSRVEMAL